MSEEKKDKFDSGEPSLEKISDYHKPMSKKKQKTLLLAMFIGILFAGSIYLLAYFFSS
ncbi:MAG: hypothetical protein ACOCP1_03200 [Campylobacterales bacterium]